MIRRLPGTYSQQTPNPNSTMDTDTSRPTIPEPQETIKRFRRGDVREDGKIFWAYKSGYGSKELWYNYEAFYRERERTNRYERLRVKSPEERERTYRRNKAWQKANVQRSTRRANARRKERRQSDPLFAMASRFRVNLHQALKSRGLSKTSQSARILGCSWQEFRDRITTQFLPGMSWDNRAEWHLDHIVPLALAKTEQDVRDLNHYSNLRPLWGKDNLRKQDTPPSREEAPPQLWRFLPPSLT